MRWLICLFFLGAASAQNVDLDSVTIPRKTDLFVTLERSLSSKTGSPGDRFHARLSVPLTVNDQIVAPVGSYIIGQIDQTRKPGFFKGKGELYLTFDTIILPNGVTRKIAAVVQSGEGAASGEGGDEGKLVATSSQSDEVIQDAEDLGVLGGAIGGARSGTLKGLGVGAAIGAATGAVLGLLRKGSDVVLPRGAELTIQLEQDTRFVSPDAFPSGKRLRP